MPYDYLAPVDPFQSLPQDTPTARAARATSLGYKVGNTGDARPGQALSYVQGQGSHGIPMYTPLNSGAFSPSLMDQMGSGLKYDVTHEQGAANRQYERNTGAAGAFLSESDKAASGVLGESDFATDLLGGFDKQLKGYGDQAVADTQQRVRATDAEAGAVEGYAGQAVNLAKGGVATAQEAVGTYNADVHAKIDAMVAGIDRRSRDQMAMIESGVQPDGQPLSAAERWQMHRELSFDTGQQTAAVTAQAWSEARNALAGLKMNAAAVQEQAGQTTLGAGQLAKQAGELRAEGTAQQQQAEALRQNYTNMRSQMMNLLVSGRATARALAAQLRVNGMSAYADMIYRNPESVVSLFAGLAQMAAISTAPGGRNAPGVNFG